MLGGSSEYVQHDSQPGSRPPKRPRNSSFSTTVFQAGSGSVPSIDVQTVAMDTGSDRPRSDQSEMPSAGAGTSRGRVDEKNTRKLSCKECRRLKLKVCFPAAILPVATRILLVPMRTVRSCIPLPVVCKRGCGSLCPDGALTSGPGSRFILAGAEQLHDKIFELSDRVRQLEDSLEVLQSQVSNQPHPLLATELLKIKTSQDLYGPSNLHLPLANPDNSSARDENLRRSVGALSLNTQPLYAESSRPSAMEHGRDRGPPNVAPDILQLSATFPFPWAVDVSMRKRIRDALPPRAEAMKICEEARNNALWQFNLDASETFLPNLLHYCYETPIEALSPRRLALLLMHLSIGSLVDLNRPLGSLHGEAYHHLARAAVCEIPLMEEPDFDVLHALFFMIWYHLIFSDNKKAVGYAWNLMGFVAKLAQGLGLHREAPRLKIIPEEHEKRRAVFWELLNMDCRMSLSLGRPPSISLDHVDVKPPTCVGPGLYVPREEIVYHEWKNAFFIQCLTPMLQAMVSVEQPDYSRITDLDKSVRDFGVPSILDEHQTHDVNPRFLVMQRALVAMGREIALLQLHRRYFTEAMNSPNVFDLKHPYAPSVIATYLGASNLISAVETLFNQEAQLSARFLHFWFNSFSAVVTLSLLISRAPSTPLASYAFQDLERGCLLFRAAAKILPFSSKALPVMQKLMEKSQRVLLQHGSNTPPAAYAEYPQPQPNLPSSFNNVHNVISQAAERIKGHATAKSGAPEGSASQSPQSLLAPPSAGVQETWLPDIYHFSSLGLNVEERYTFFVSSSPRVAENEKFNFDHGALSSSLVEETSYMAWF
ncbi:hypothetical protein CPB84DRAFT_1960943 [Gymnopilus junonius]|uniref:Xylanolytic transcriptional activator regulatory domain-containing protein n=1 Tax=Gymnopilus junonius TaxID=109634 RepID=A0A9P5NSW4_GYMJU|nr:hypothetical protein CPB84DRAFT_1960943 [Gymnopilus junonius]